eukprot:Protomagalhaensia_sp_Gyna_25__1671@NODE_1870_length_1460_cov_1875_439831_g1538_i0_p1_GENE_NODE_1870_length_1460_cov_1875_439831_g1538_i0NODE_1870_length_1460_cov_1875_439831_g1538_i0_p1_ORF_typecomplete_len246_score36_23Redoxin/PF08534_10/2_3e27Glutaredoxin/PF00462_24/5_2e03Glutaredoxin/PF00462_24/9_2e12AhpCTSA/PF00578_21/1e07AhpCTSA/PF00578_21/1_9e03GST_N_3/PF13417_6/0_0054DUF836/PF05768_14/0_011SH3BGR/PF04908_15/0_018Thioredoxin_3/PF13192_6/0_064Thioredoxin_4/PF13462_6/35Thioredoxin_4/PF13462_
MPTSSMEGKQIPDTTFKVYTAGSLQDLKIREACKGKTVAIFSLPGAFTPTCSASHLPRYEELATSLYMMGVDEIYCLSVNDAYVMNAWAKHHEVVYVKMLPDGNGEFSQGMDLLVDKSAIGFGKRSWRYSMLIKDNVIQKMFIEPEEGADPYGASDADTMLHYLNPHAKPPHRIALLTKKGCPYCASAKSMLEAKEFKYIEIPLSDSIRSVAVGAITGKSTVPQVFIDGKYIGGSEELKKALDSM